MKSSLKCSCTMSVRSFRCSTFSVLPVSSTLSKTGALVCGGGPFKRDGAPNCDRFFAPKSLHAMERVPFHRVLLSTFQHSLRISIIVSSCGSRYDFLFFAEPHFTAECAIAFVTAPKSGVCSCSVGSILGKIHHALFTGCLFTL